MKEYRDIELIYYVKLMAVLFFLMCTPVFQGYVQNDLTLQNLIAIGGYALITYSMTLVTKLFDGIISSSLKQKLLLKKLPGQTIFTRIKNDKIKDNRFTIEEAKIAYHDHISVNFQPQEKQQEYENAAWYKIYQAHQEKGSVFQTQKDYLMFRDLYVQSLCLLVLYLTLVYFLRDIVAFSSQYLLVQVVFALLFWVSAHSKANRFVNTVIAVDLAERKE